MRTSPEVLRNIAASVSALLSVALIVFVLASLYGDSDGNTVSAWFGATLTLLVLGIFFNLVGRSRPAAWLALLSMASGLVVLVAYLLLFNGLLESPVYWGLDLLDLIGLHLSAGIALFALGTAVFAVAARGKHEFAAEITVVGALLVFVMVSLVWVTQPHAASLGVGEFVPPLSMLEAGLLLAASILLLLQLIVLPAGRFDIRYRFLPALIFAFLFGVSLHLWLALVVNDQLDMRQQTRTTAERLSAGLSMHMSERVEAIERMARRMETEREGVRRAQWQRDAEQYLSDFESISTIAWVSSDRIVEWIVSQSSLNYQEGDEYAADPMRRAMLSHAFETRATAFSEPLALGGGAYGQVMAVPLFDGDRFRGWLLSGVRYDPLFEQQVGLVAPEFAVKIVSHQTPIYIRTTDSNRHPLAHSVQKEVRLANLTWHVHVWPMRKFFAQYVTWLPGFLLALGIIAAMLFAFSLFQLETQRRRAATLRESEERFRVVAEQTGEVVYDYHIGSGRIQWAGAIKDVLRVDPDDFADVDIEQWESLLHPDDRDAVIRELERAEEHLERFHSQYRFRRGDGTYIRVDDRGVFLPDRDGKATRLLGAMSDVTERHEFENQLRYLAHFDQQTGLHNRVWFMEDSVLETESALEQNESRWLIFMDVDRFKAINATLGHTVGDLLLEVVARRLEAFVGGRGALARLGGDEFAVSISGRQCDRQGMLAFCEALMQEFASPLYVGGHSLFVTLSAGIACFPEDGKNAQEVIRAAETAMFRAKQRGKNTYTFYEASMSAGSREKLELANSLRTAMENNEFHLVFQPRYGLKSGRITGMEALLRWESASRGNVPPALFIPVAEETGLIGPIGWYVVDAAAAAARRLGADRMLGRRVAINVSARQLADADFVPELIRRVHAAGAMPHWFEIELTESLIMDDPQYTSELLDLMHEAGFTISIDDFGTGYSSLSYLKNFAVDNLKIDRSFVMGLPGSQDDAAIVRTIIGMGNELGLRLIAEGIETEEQSQFLRDAGCQEAQGYLFAQPMSLEKLIALLD